MSTKSKPAVVEVVEEQTELLEVNVYYGRIPEDVASEESAVNIDPFAHNGFRVTSVPVFLHDPMAAILTNGVVVPRRSPADGDTDADGGVHITGEQIARGYAWYSLLQQVSLLSSVVAPGSLTINIARCGLIGKYAMRFLVGIPGIKVSFLGFPTSWRGLDKIAPIANQHYFFNTAKEEPVAEVLEESIPESPVVPETVPKAKKTTKKAVKADKPVEATESSPVAKKKAAPKKAPAVAASEEQLSVLADKFPSAKKAPAKKKQVPVVAE